MTHNWLHFNHHLFLLLYHHHQQQQQHSFHHLLSFPLLHFPCFLVNNWEFPGRRETSLVAEEAAAAAVEDSLLRQRGQIPVAIDHLMVDSLLQFPTYISFFFHTLFLEEGKRQKT